MAVRRDVRVAIEVVTDGESLGQRQVVRHYVGMVHRDRPVPIAEGHRRSVAGQRGFASSGLQLAEHLIVGAVLFGDEDQVLDGRLLFARKKGNRVVAAIREGR